MRRSVYVRTISFSERLRDHQQTFGADQEEKSDGLVDRMGENGVFRQGELVRFGILRVSTRLFLFLILSTNRSGLRVVELLMMSFSIYVNTTRIIIYVFHVYDVHFMRTNWFFVTGFCLWFFRFTYII